LKTCGIASLYLLLKSIAFRHYSIFNYTGHLMLYFVYKKQERQNLYTNYSGY